MTSEYLYKEHAKTKESDDLWGQVFRTVQGKPVGQDQIQMIVEAIRAGLNFKANDVLLDLACGNGALSNYFFDELAGFHGVDYSGFLIGVAKDRFENAPSFQFTEMDVNEFVDHEKDREKYTKALCYGSFAYFNEATANKVLQTVYERFENVQTFYIGNIPDLDRASNFYKESIPAPSALADSSTSIGTWRSQSDFESLADRTGWTVEFHEMPKDFFAAHYRYDVILSR
jgi:cyclopropane fatty-acyl-phospholipid synthase-like methyltransferase